MKHFFTSLFAVLLAATTAFAAPAAPSFNVEQFQEAAVVRMMLRRDSETYCNDCSENLDVCMKYGFGPSKNIEHCADICATFMCRKFPQCRKCEDKYNHCNPAHQVHL